MSNEAADSLPPPAFRAGRPGPDDRAAYGGGSGVGRRPGRPAAMFSEPLPPSSTTGTTTFSEPTARSLRVLTLRARRRVAECARYLSYGWESWNRRAGRRVAPVPRPYDAMGSTFRTACADLVRT